MSRYIDKDAVRRAIQEYCCIQEEITPDGIAKVVMSVPTVDVVEVVRCKDCIHFISGSCNYFGYYTYVPDVDEDGYCSYGERREG